MSTGLTDLPTDIVRDIFDLLDDEHLLPFLHVCRVARILGFVTLLTRHKIIADADSPQQISFTSGNARDLGKNLNDITKLAVHHDNAPGFLGLGVLARVCLSLPNLVELDLNIHHLRPSTPDMSSENGLVDLMKLLSERRSGISNLLILHDGYWSVAKCRDESTESSLDTRRISTVFMSYLLQVLSLGTFIRDSIATSGQRGRFREDTREFMLQVPFKRSAALRFEFKSLQPGTFPSWIHENWSLVVFNGNKMTGLTMGHSLRHRLPAKMNCGPALSSVYFPQLRSLQICKKVELSMADITPFLARHPTIETLMLNHHSLSLPLSTPGVKWPMPNLTALEAPLHYLEAILRDIDVRRLSTICIGKRPQGQGNITEQKFDFNTLDRVLETLTNSSATSLMIVLPGGLKSRAWLAAASSSAGTQRAETRMVMVKTVTIFTESDEPFHRGIGSHLRDWSRLFSSIKLLQCTIQKDWPSYNEETNNPTPRNSVPWRDCKFCGQR